MTKFWIVINFNGLKIILHCLLIVYQWWWTKKSAWLRL